MKYILASNSPRRKNLLENLGVSFEVMASDIDENIDPTSNPYEVASRLAHEKAKDIAARVKEEAIIIAADTIVVAGEILGKPKDEVDAYTMLRALSGRSHKVVTGIAVINSVTNKTAVDYSVTNVYFKELSDAMIYKYIASGEPMDKAGAYGIQGKAALFVDKIEGDYFNVVGMPLNKLQEILSEFFNMSLI